MSSNKATGIRCLLAYGLAWPALAQAGELSIDCPSSLAVDAAVHAPAGWRAFDPPQPHALARVGVFSGPPEEGASLVPDKTSTKGLESTDVWSFGRGVPEGLWVACYYNGTTASLVQKVELAATRCEVRHQMLRNGTRVKVLGMRCQ
jgi:hypothetical protein